MGLVLAAGCAHDAARSGGAGTFGDDMAFLRKHMETVVLTGDGGARVAVVPALQGRVMTSAARGDEGLSFGWINRDLIASGKTLEHFNPFGGEERLWLGPEGGQFGLYFTPGKPFDLANWYVPPAIDTEPFEVVKRGPGSLAMRRKFQVLNYSGTKFDVQIDRTVRVLPPAEAWKEVAVPAQAGVDLVAYASDNRITNTGAAAWKKQTGLVSLWILGMFTPSPQMTIVAPIQPGPESERGRPVVDDYFGKVPPQRLVAREKVVYFRADGNERGKIGFGPKRCTGVLGAYDAAGRVLTVVTFTFDPNATDYVNSMWSIQKEPYGGDVANCYNDGPPAPGKKPMGPFCELESSSPALALGPGQSYTHTHRTMHFTGPEAQLDVIARRALGVGIDEIKAVFTEAQK
jgi:hypothetical protein